METRNGFTFMSLVEFETWITRQQVTRTVLHLQQHHTWSPAYAQFTGRNHFELQAGMKHHHVSNNGWADIGQHFTTFPDGSIMTGRSLGSTPACIYGNNSGGICIEHLGNFDNGRDVMTTAQKETAVRMSSAICRRFNIPVNTDRVVYHHWFDLKSGARRNGAGDTKSCPGTAFFGGNSLQAAESNFLPLVRAALRRQSGGGGGGSGNDDSGPISYGYVNAESLNVRRRPGADQPLVSSVTLGSIVRIYSRREGWLRIARDRQEWVSARFVQEVSRATVNADTLNVRSEPSASSTKVASLSRGQEVFIHARENGWCRIGPEHRWVKESFLTPAS